MNNTLWWDGIDGNNLVCRPGNKSEGGFAIACLIVTRIAPSVLLLSGICFFTMSWLQIKLTRTVQADTDNSAIKPRTAIRLGSRKTKVKGSHSPQGNHGATLALVLGAICLCVGLLFSINGHGTIFPSDTLPGKVGDACFAIYYCTLWYLSLIQVRGAKWFNSLVVMPTGNDGVGQGNKWSRLPSVPMVLDSIQGRFGPFIALTVWFLLAAGVLPREWFYCFGHTSTAGFGFRAFFAIATQRVSALRKVAAMQNEVRGTPEDKKRRKGILRNKTFGLVIDLTGVFFITVACPASLVLLGSTFSSRQLVIHYAVMFPPICLGSCLLVVAMYAGIIKARKRQRGRSSLTSAGLHRGQKIIVESELSGNSVVNQSAFAVDVNDYVPNNGGGKTFNPDSPGVY